ncbi:hypothetical protein AMTR_s00196p00041840 [Amborella trichopoda]|uniref:Uncharacterized protein n=1 Tax=Amborella trichopoda TaxID=13333 RepID=U5DCX4_AMBTC|nr:hypothetical protein AMTR_s00196p00041840 [Amborella trichopoda]
MLAIENLLSSLTILPAIASKMLKRVLTTLLRLALKRCTEDVYTKTSFLFHTIPLIFPLVPSFPLPPLTRIILFLSKPVTIKDLRPQSHIQLPNS